jgi:hypothetical protein
LAMNEYYMQRLRKEKVNSWREEVIPISIKTTLPNTV